METGHPTAIHTTHAEYIADHTDLTPREAEAFFRYYFAENYDESPTVQRKRTTKMQVSASVFSRHLSNAREKLDSDDASMDLLTELLIRTPIGGGDGKTK